MSWEEKRKFPRIPVDLQASYEFGGVSRNGRVIDLSLDGCLLTASELHDSGDQLSLTFSIPTSTRPITSRVRVVWAGIMKATGPRTFGLGLHFEDLPPANKEEIEQYLRNLLII